MTLKMKLARTALLVTPHWLKKKAYRSVKKKGKPTGKPVVTRANILRDLKAIGVKAGDVVMAHVALSPIGQVDGGPNTVIQALLDAVGQNGTLLMPAFPPWPANPKDRIVFDARNTPTNTGAVHEAFRKWPGVKRSLHPTHSVCALGPKAEEIVSGHEQAPTSFEDGTPFDWLVKHGGKILLIGNNNSTLVHWIELRAGLPNTHEDHAVKATVISPHGASREVTVKRHTLGERLIRVEDSSDDSPDFLLLQDYCLIPFKQRLDEIRALGFLKRGSRFLSTRQKELEGREVIRLGRVGEAPSALLEAGPFAKRMLADLKANIARFKKYYSAVEGLSRNWNEVQWYHLVLHSRAALSLLKAYRRAFKIR